MKKINISYIALIGLLMMLTGSAFAGTATSNMTVSAIVSPTCTISAGALAFGTYDPMVANAASPLNSTATLSVTCSNGASTTITLGQGLNDVSGTAAAPQRQMANGGNFLSYGLFQDNSHLITWGNTAPTGAVYVGTGAADTVTVFGQIPAGQNLPSGTYTDTVVATITF